MESILLSGRGTVVIFSYLLAKWDFTVSVSLPFFGGKHLSLKTLFPPLGSAILTGSYPVIISHEGIMLNPYEGRYKSSGRNSFRYSGIKKIGVSGPVLLINGEKFCRMHSDYEANYWKDKILSVAEAPAERRDPLADEIISSTFDNISAAKRIEQIFIAVKPLRLTVNLLYIFLFISAPLMVIFFSLETVLIPVLVLLSFLHFTAVYIFYKTYKNIFAERDAPWAHIISMAFFPPALIRSVDYFFKDSMLNFNPAAVSLGLLPLEKSEELISFLIREYTFFNFKSDDTFELDVFESYRRSMLQGIESLIQRNVINLDKVLLPPPQYGNIKLYCPRCHCQYTDDVSICEDCNVKLKKY